MKQNQQERVTLSWQACVLACALAIFACLTFNCATAFADEAQGGQAALQANVQTADIPGGSSFETAATIDFDSNTEWTNTFTDASTDSFLYFKIVLNKDGYISFPESFKYADGDKTGDTGRIYLYHSDEGKTEFWDAYSDTYPNQKLGLAKGTYYLKCSAQKYTPGSVITMKMNFTVADNWEKESNDTFDTANEIAVNNIYYGSDAENAVVDYYKFYVTGAQNAYVTVWSEKSMEMALYRGNPEHDSIVEWTQAANTSGSANGKATKTLTEGWYYFKVNPSGEYHFQISASDGTVKMYRLYNPYSGEHLFTNDTDEVNALVKIGWKNEGEAWKSPSTSDVPVYRVYNKYSGDHHYTTDKKEYEACGKAGWTKEGIAFYSDESKGSPIYRVYNQYETVGTHHYTTEKKEYEACGKVGWIQEGIGWYGLK